MQREEDNDRDTDEHEERGDEALRQISSHAVAASIGAARREDKAPPHGREDPETYEHCSSRKLFVDSGAWIALFSARDQHHVEADTLVREAIALRVPLVTTNLVLAEVHRLLLFRAGARPAMAAPTRIEDSKRMTIEFATALHHRRAREWLDKLADQTITYTDAASFAVMEALRCTDALTFDHDFLIAGFSRWLPAGR